MHAIGSINISLDSGGEIKECARHLSSPEQQSPWQPQNAHHVRSVPVSHKHKIIARKCKYR